jgi:DNA-binding NtrC family response regulator
LLVPESNGPEPITDPLVAAFEVGRWLNRLAFHLQQAWFFGGDHIQAARDAARALGRAQVIVRPVADRERIRLEITARVEGLLGQSESEEHLDDLTNLEADLRSDSYCPEWHGSASERRRSLLAPVVTEIGQLCELLGPHLDDQARQALSLGAKVDQGLCRPDISLHLAPPAGKPYRPGEPPTEGEWFADVRQLWAELGLPVPAPTPPDRAPGGVGAGPQVAAPAEELVGRLARAAHEGLRALSGAGSQPTAVPAGTQGPVVPPQTVRPPAAPGPSPLAPPPAADQQVGEHGQPAAPGPSQLAPPPRQPALEGAAEKRRRRELLDLKKKMDPEGKYIGESLPILRLFEAIDTFNKDSDAPVLLVGASGAGKSEIAELIHRTSGRSAKPFRREQATDNKGADLNITKGRWVGYGRDSGLANIPRQGTTGILQDCAGGTVFVDELTETSLDFQTFQLSVLDGKPIPLTAGNGPPVTPAARMIFATNLDPDEAVRDGKLKHDLLRRLSTQIIYVPALRERTSDTFLFVHDLCGDHRPEPGFLLALLRYDWPGNVGELRNVLKLAVSKTSRADESLKLDHLTIPDQSVIEEVRGMSKDEVKGEVCRQLVATLQAQGFAKGRGRQRRMAEILKVSESTVSKMLKGGGGSGGP